MDQKVQKVNPDYKAIFTDIIFKKFGKVTEEFSFYLKKDTLSVLEIIDLNNKIFAFRVITEQQARSIVRTTNRIFLRFYCINKNINLIIQSYPKSLK